MEDRVREILATVLGVPESHIGQDTSPERVESWDSLRHMKLVVALEDDFGVEFTDGQIAQMLSFSRIVQTVQEALAEAAS